VAPRWMFKAAVAIWLQQQISARPTRPAGLECIWPCFNAVAVRRLLRTNFGPPTHWGGGGGKPPRGASVFLIR